MKKEAFWDEFCKKNNLNKESCQTWYATQRTQYGKLSAEKSGQGAQELSARNKWIVDNFLFLKDHIVRHMTAKSKFRKPAATATATAADDYEDEPTVHVEPLPTSGPGRRGEEMLHMMPTYSVQSTQGLSVLSRVQLGRNTCTRHCVGLMPLWHPCTL